MGLIFLTCSLFLPIFVSHLVVFSSIDTPLEWFDPWPTFYHFLLCIRGFQLKNRVDTLLFFEQSRTSSLLVEFLMWKVVGWVVSVARYSWVLMVSVDYFFCDQRPLFHCFFFERSSSHLSAFLFCH